MSCFGGFRSNRINPEQQDDLQHYWQDWRLPPTMRIVVDGRTVYVPPNYAHLLAAAPPNVMQPGGTMAH